MLNVFCVLIFILFVTTGFLYDDCPAPAPCKCTYDAIECGDRNLGGVPAFHTTSLKQLSSWSLNLSGNSIPGLLCNGFFNLQSFSNGQDIYIDLSSNNIRVNSFCIDAFHGIENNVTWLNLDDNELTSIPFAIGQLKHLETLSVLHNPLTTIDESVIISIRRTLSHISIPNMSTWPDAVQYLTKLITLELQGFSRNIPVDAFKGFRSALVELYLHGFNFTTIPSAV